MSISNNHRFFTHSDSGGISPYLYGMILTKLLSKRKAITASVLLISVIATAGVFLLIDAMYIHPDAQSALAFVVIPVYQWGLLLLATIPIYIINKKGKEKDEH